MSVFFNNAAAAVNHVCREEQYQAGAGALPQQATPQTSTSNNNFSIWRQPSRYIIVVLIRPLAPGKHSSFRMLSHFRNCATTNCIYKLFFVGIPQHFESVWPSRRPDEGDLVVSTHRMHHSDKETPNFSKFLLICYLRVM